MAMEYDFVQVYCNLSNYLLDIDVVKFLCNSSAAQPVTAVCL